MLATSSSITLCCDKMPMPMWNWVNMGMIYSNNRKWTMNKRTNKPTNKEINQISWSKQIHTALYSPLHWSKCNRLVCSQLVRLSTVSTALMSNSASVSTRVQCTPPRLQVSTSTHVQSEGYFFIFCNNKMNNHSKLVLTVNQRLQTTYRTPIVCFWEQLLSTAADSAQVEQRYSSITIQTHLVSQ